VRGATIVSTEDVFIYLVREFQPTYILLAGEVAGVFEHADVRGAIIPVITPDNVATMPRRWRLACTDVTGGISARYTKCSMWCASSSDRGALFSGAVRGNVQRLLIDPRAEIARPFGPRVGATTCPMQEGRGRLGKREACPTAIMRDKNMSDDTLLCPSAKPKTTR